MVFNPLSARPSSASPARSTFSWGALDLAVTRFSGRRAPLHPAGIPALPDDVAQEAYDREVSSAGFWPGGNGIDYPAFYAYAYPAPNGYRTASVKPEAAFWHDGLSEFMLPYEAVQTAADPDEALMAFLVSTYEAAANLGRMGPRPAGMCAGKAAPRAQAGCRIGEKMDFLAADGTVEREDGPSQGALPAGRRWRRSRDDLHVRAGTRQNHHRPHGSSRRPAGPQGRRTPGAAGDRGCKA